MVVDSGLDAVVRVDPTTGDRTIISGIDPLGVYDMVGSGPGFGSPGGIAVEADGSLVVVDGSLKAVVRVDPNGQRATARSYPRDHRSG